MTSHHEHRTSFDIAISYNAGKDMREIRNFLTRKFGEETAQKITKNWFDAMELIRFQPEQYQLDPILSKHGNFRFIKKGSYKIFYEFTGFDVYVIRVIHAKRDFSRIFKDFKP